MIGAAAVIVIIIIAVFLYGGQKSQAPGVATSTGTSTPAANASGTPASTSTGSTSGNGSGSGSTGKTGGSGTTAPQHPAPFVIHFITPAANAQWKIGTSNSISWDKAGNITGVIDLLDSKGNYVGAILSETGSGQTSYSWDTREYSLSRYSPLKKELLAGTYKIRISFDGNNLPPIVSPAITITN